MKRAKLALETRGNLRLHKIASNSPQVLNAFPSEDLAKDIKDLDLGTDELPFQRSLGLIWNLQTDTFTFRLSKDIKPYTKRGILSTVNSVFDPLGFVALVVIQGKAFLRDFLPSTNDWDDPLPPERQDEWEDWRDSLSVLDNLNISRTYLDVSPNHTVRKELHVFADASEKAIAAVAYMKAFYEIDTQQVSFIPGKAKLAPLQGHSIPRLELCAAVLAVEICDMILAHLETNFDGVYFYTDSRVVLGYINNQSRKFYMYVTNRVDRIRKSSDPNQWSHVSTEMNPADCATRALDASSLTSSTWLSGPTHLLRPETLSQEDGFPLINADDDKEIRPNVTTLSTVGRTSGLGSHRFERFSRWRNLVQSVAHLKHIARSY